MWKEAPEMTPFRWAVVGTALAAGIVALGYMAGESSNESEQQQGKMQGAPNIQQYLEMMKQNGMQVQHPSAQTGKIGQIRHNNDSDDEMALSQYGARIESDEDEDSDLDMSSIGNSQSRAIANSTATHQLMQLNETFRKLVQMKKYFEASVVGEKFLNVVIKDFGKDSQQYSLFSVEVAGVYKEVDVKRSIELYKFAFNSLIAKTAESTQNIKLCVSISLELNHLLSDIESLEYAEKTYQALEWWVNSEEDNLEASQFLGLWVSHVMLIYRKLGLWKKVEACFQKFLAGQIKSVGYNNEDMIESYVSALHQQGKTEESIQVIEKFLKEIEEGSETNTQRAIEWAHERMSKFYFYLDDFENTEKCLVNLRKFYEIHHPEESLPMSLSAYTQLMTACVELKKDEVFDDLERKVKIHEPDNTSYNKYATYVRSRYLITQEISITTHYKITLKVCINRPNRPEGEAEKPETELDRKLTKFFIETFFEDPCKSGAELTSSQEANHYDIDIVSPNFSGTPTPYRWYTVKIYLYKDSSKEELLGRHFQLCYLKPDALARKIQPNKFFK